MQEGDVKLFQTDDDGDITIENGIVEMTGGLESAAYLSLFGGNEDDPARSDNAANWWGNLGETETAFQYRSETQNLLQAIPATSGNLKRIEDAVSKDLAWFLSENVASSVVVAVSMPALNRVNIDVSIEARGEISQFNFVENWEATR